MYYKIIILSFFILLCLSCTDRDIIDNEGVKNNQIVLTPEEYVSIAYDNPKELSEEEIANTIFEFQNNIENKELTTRKQELPKISIKKKYYISENIHNNKNDSITRSFISEEITVPIFEVELSSNNDKKKLAFVCGDERMPKVLLYIDNYKSTIEISDRTQFLLELSKKNILTDINHIEYIKSKFKNSTLNKIAEQLNLSKNSITYQNIKDYIIIKEDECTRNNNPGNKPGGISRPTTSIVGFVNPLSKVIWHQNYPYNYSMPVMNIYDGYQGEYEGNIPVGCANVAIGILFTIIKPSMSINNGKRVDWEYVTSVNSIYGFPGEPNYGSPQDLIDMISGLLSEIAIATDSKPSYEEKELADINTEQKYMKSVITQTETSPNNMINYLRTMTRFTGNERTKFNGNLAKQSLFDRKPVLLYGPHHNIDKNGNISGKEGGHVWLIDGVVITKHPLQMGYDHYWSVNIGWGYETTYFRTSNDLQDCDVSFPTKDSQIAYYTQEMTMLYNITNK